MSKKTPEPSYANGHHRLCLIALTIAVIGLVGVCVALAGYEPLEVLRTAEAFAK